MEVRHEQESCHELSMNEYVDEGDIGKDMDERCSKETVDDNVVYLVPDLSRTKQEV